MHALEINFTPAGLVVAFGVCVLLGLRIVDWRARVRRKVRAQNIANPTK